MKLNSLVSSLTFTQESLFKDFQDGHEGYLNQNPVWSLSATRRRLIISFWLKNVILDHYLILILLGTIVVWGFQIHQPVKPLMISALPAYLLVFIVLFLSMYYPVFQIEYLPQLDNWIENYKGMQLEGIQECKKQQHSAVALMLIETTSQKLAGMDSIINNMSTAEILARKYGISTKSVNSALNLIIRGDWNQNKTRKRTEILDDFDTAREHYRQISSEKAIVLLDRLQQKILQVPSK